MRILKQARTQVLQRSELSVSSRASSSFVLLFPMLFMSRPRLRSRHQQFIVAWVGTAKRETRFSSTGSEGATYDLVNNADGCRGVLYRAYKTGTAKRSGTTQGLRQS